MKTFETWLSQQPDWVKQASVRNKALMEYVFTSAQDDMAGFTLEKMQESMLRGVGVRWPKQSGEA